ncbi:uncharacterized protein LOC116212261 [Punica granatum]|nr:uncharacterized protein LOC116212261 [Punica granatum]
MASHDNSSSFGFLFRTEYNEFCGEVSEDFASKLNIDGADDGSRQRQSEGEESEQSSRVSFESAASDHQREDDEQEDDHEEEFEFSFACVNPDGSPIAADDVFQDGQIRPIYPLFDRSLLFGDSRDEAKKSTGREAAHPRPPLRKLFVEMAEPEELRGVDEETYCVWNGKKVEEAASPESCRKSNSTGFSKRWRFRDLVNRSNSDGKDAFVFLNPHKAHDGRGGKVQHAKKDEEVGVRTAARKEGKTATASGKGQTAHEKHYVRNRAAKESDRRKSYLPYRQDLVGLGFFTNVNGMTRNVHPF